MVISIFKFLSRYYGIDLNAAVKCSHTDLKRNFRFIKACTYQYVSIHIDMVKTGKIIYVKDSYGNIEPYMCPENINCFSRNNCSYVKEEKRENSILELDDALDLPTYQLLELMARYKHRHSIYRFLKKELIRRGFYEVKIYKLEKEELCNELDREEYFYDKYKGKRKIKRKKP